MWTSTVTGAARDLIAPDVREGSSIPREHAAPVRHRYLSSRNSLAVSGTSRPVSMTR